jgi:chitin disaccharide deacetylase
MLVVNADDLGLAHGVNEGIIEAHVGGLVTSASLMVGRPAAREAAELADDHRALSIGLHFEHDDSVDLDDAPQAERAFLAQLERFRELVGRDPTHVDSHHHVHAHGERLERFKQLVEPIGVPLRHAGQVAYIGGFWGQPDLEDVSAASLRKLIASQVADGFSELACHPGRISEDLRSSYLHEREAELATLTEAGLPAEIEHTGVRLVSYHQWPG